MTFKELNLIEPLLSALEKKGYTEPTPIQAQAIPAILQGKDLFGLAQTGTGKTAAFSLPLLQLLHNSRIESQPRKHVSTLILAPTRELAAQIGENFTAYGNNLGFKNAVIFGGVSQGPQVDRLRRGVDVIIATPGRLLDLIQQGYISLKNIEYFVLDEADRMLDMGFIHDIKKVIAMLPKKKHTLFFSATANPDIQRLSATILHNPVQVEVTPVSSTAERIEQKLFYVAKEDKRSLLKWVLDEYKIDHVLVFGRTKRGCDRIAKDLNKAGVQAEAIHGDKSQGARERAMKGFKNRTLRVLVATDIAARGIDVDKLSHVINMDLPEVSETYVHRIGRTGRKGETGIALSFCMPDEKKYLKDIEKLINKRIEVVSSHPYV
jgi:ATP-dependent RNA helicase RhlE